MDKIKILNIFVNNLSRSEFLDGLKQGVVFTVNADHIVKLQKDYDFYKAYKQANYVVCDSKILYYASRFLKSPIREKISGSDLFPAFYEYHKDNEEIKIFLLGAAEGVARKAQEKINTKVSRDMVIEAYSPFYGFEKNEEECLKIVDCVNQSGATVLAVGLGAPKQEKFICQYKDKMPNVKIFLAIGATIDFEAGCKARAPKWMSEVGLEWLHRMFSEPKRLWRRYLVDDAVFFWLILQQKFNIYASPFSSSIADHLDGMFSKPSNHRPVG